ncbi:ATP-binding protein, partial [Microbacterium sp.]|uniref:ATP-binding protein n=1 Tax=Microbacterium sp. TaxID=51671 RepID=UPI003C772434
VELFVQRAGAVRPGFTLTTRVVDAVVALCRALEGVPLAIELAAARLRSLTAEELLERLDMALSAWDGPRDLPERQRTLRATIAWSVDLLDEAERAALAALAVFQGAFTFDSAESVLVESGVADPAAAVAALVDASLVGRAADLDGDYRLLTSVRAFGSELATPEERERATVAWIAHYRRVVADSAARLRGPEQLERLRALDRESENIAAVARTLVHRGDYEAAAEFAWSLYLYLWIGGYLGVVRALMVELLATAPAADLAPRARAIALYYCAAVRFWQDPSFDPIPDLSEARDLFEHDGDGAAAALAAVSIGLGWLARPLDPDGPDGSDGSDDPGGSGGSDDPDGSGGPDVPAATVEFERSLAGFRAAHDVWGQAMALVVLGRVGLALGDPTAAKARFEESLALASAQGERLGIVIARSHRGWTRFLLGDLAGARDDFAESLDHSLQLRHDESIAYGLEGFVALRAVESDAGAAGRLLGVARTLRRRKGILNPGAFDLFAGPVQELRDRGLSAELDAAIAQGATMSVSEVLADVHD